MGGSAMNLSCLSTSSHCFIVTIVAGMAVVPNRSRHWRLSELRVSLQAWPWRRLHDTSESHRSLTGCPLSSGITHETKKN